MKRSLLLLFSLFFIITTKAQMSYKQTFYVKDTATGMGDGRSWSNASSNLDSVLQEAKAYDVILVAEGVYEGNFIMKEGVNVYGGYPKDITNENPDPSVEYERKSPGEGENLTVLKPRDNQGRPLSQYTKFSIPTVWDGFSIEGGNLNIYSFGENYPYSNIITGKSGEAIGILYNYNDYTGIGKMVSKEMRFTSGYIWGPDQTIPGLSEISSPLGAYSDKDGKTNTQKILDYLNNNTTYRNTPVHICDTFSLGGFTDWYLPASGEIPGIFNWNVVESMKTIGGDIVQGNPTDTSEIYYTSTQLSAENAWAYSYGLKSFEKKHSLRVQPVHLINLANNDSTSNLSGGGVHLLEGGIVRNCIIRNNSAKTGGGAYLGEGAKLEGCLVLDNRADDNIASGIYSKKGIILNVTAINNYSYNYPVPLNSSSVFSDGGIVANSIICSSQFSDINFSDFRHDNGCIVAGVATTNGINATMAVDEYDFVNYSARNFNLNPSSSLVNSGQRTYLSTDFNFSINNKLVVPDSLDLGAYQLKKKAIYIKRFEAYDKIYNGKTDLSWSYPEFEIVNPDNDYCDIYINFEKSRFETPDVGVNKEIIFDLTIEGNSKDDYPYVPVMYTGDIVKAYLTITAAKDSMIFGTDPTTLTFANYTASGLVEGETKSVITTAPTITLSETITSTSASGVYPNSLTPSDAVAKNYNIFYSKNSFIVKPKHLFFDPIPTKTYGDTIFEIKAVHNLGKEIIIESTNPNILEITKVDNKWQGKIKGAGKIKLTAKFAGDAQAIAEESFQDLEVKKAKLTVVADSIKMVVGTDPNTLDISDRYTISGFVNGENSDILTSKPPVVISAYINASSAIGVYPNAVWIGYMSYSNYSVSSKDNYLEIVPNHDLVIFDTFPNLKTYGDTTFVITGSHVAGKQLTFESENTDIVEVNKVGTDWIATIKGAGTTNLKAKFGGDLQNPAEEVSRSITIAKASLTITADSVVMIYGTNPGSINLTGKYTTTGFVYNETKTVLGTQPTISIDPSIISSSSVGLHTDKVLASGAVANNYTITYKKNNLRISPNVGHLSFDTIPNKTYGDSVFTLIGNHDLGKQITFESDNSNIIEVNKVGSNWKATIKGTGTVNLKAKFGGDNQASAEEIIRDITVAKAPLTITADSVVMIFGTNPTTINLANKYTATGFVYNETKTALSTQPTISIDNSITAITPVGVYVDKVLASGAVANNYTITHKSNKVYIKLYAGNITFDTVPNKTYGDAVFTLTGSHSLGKQLIFESENASIVEVNKVGSDWKAIIKGTGTVTLKAKFAGDNQTSSIETSRSITVAKAPLTITADSVVMTYGTNPATINLTDKYTATGFVYSETKTVLNTQPTISIDNSITATTPVGVHADKVLASGATASNYTITHKSNKLRVTQNSGSITFDTIPNKTYGDAVFTLTGSHSLGKQLIFESEDASIVEVNKVGSDWKATIKGTGTVTLKAKFEGDNQTSSIETNRSITVAKAPLTIEADSVTMLYGTNPATINLTNKYNISGFVYNETKSVLNTQPIISIDNSITVTTPVGVHADKVLVSGATASNYTITHKSNKLRVTQNSGNITFDIIPTKIYGDAIFALTATHSLGKEITFESNNSNIIAVNKVGTVWQATIKGVGTVALKAKFNGDNQTSAEESSQNVTIKKAQLTIEADSVAMLYGTDPATINLANMYNITGFVYNETKTVFTTQPVISIDNSITATTPAGVYADKVLVSGATANNYEITHKNNKLRVKPKSGNITFDIIQNKTYGDSEFTITANHALGKQVTIESDNTSVIKIEKVGSDWKGTIKGAGTVNLKAKFEGDSQALAEEVNQNVIVKKGLLTIKANSVNMVYGSNTDTVNLENKYSTTGFVYNETETVLVNMPVVNIESSITSTTDAGLYSGKIKVSGATSNNYEIGYTYGDLTITKASQEIDFPNLGTVVIGSSNFTANATVNTGLALTYTSNNTTVAEISVNGEITIKGIGSVTITATQAGNNNYLQVTESKELTVVEDLGELEIIINGENIAVTRNMYYDMGASIISNLNIDINPPLGSTVSPESSFVVIIDKPMIKVIEIVITDNSGNKENYILTIEKRFDFNKIVVTRWNNTLTVINKSEVTSDYNLETYKWFCNGVEVGTGQSYYTGSKGNILNPNDKYMVEVTSPDFEGILRTTEGSPALRSMNIRAYPNPVNRGEIVYVETDIEESLLEGATIQIYNYRGMYLGQIAVKGRLTPINLQDADLYIFKLSGRNGLNKELRIIVK